MKSKIAGVETAGAAEALRENITPDAVRSYSRYWKSIVPDGHREYYLRWLFSFMSVRSRWQNNVDAYLGLAGLPPTFTPEHLRRVLVESAIGLWNTRTKGVWKFHSDFWQSPDSWYPLRGEGLRDCRNRLAKLTTGVKHAKVSFALEMAFPFNREVVCLDTHILQLYGIRESIAPALYEKLESHWCETCVELQVPPVIARHIIWDRIRGESSTRYWSFVFETPRCWPKATSS